MATRTVRSSARCLLPGSSAELSKVRIEERLLRCITAGYFQNSACRKEASGKYSLVGRLEGQHHPRMDLNIHPSSVLRVGHTKRGTSLVIFNELVQTSKPYLRTVSAVERDWLAEHSGGYFEERI